jgi:anti-sigma factor RsiW
MRCPSETPQSVDLLLAFIANRLDALEAAAMAEHAARCPACREWIAGMGSVRQGLDAWEAPPVSADFDRRLFARVEKEVPWWDVLLRPFRPAIGRRTLPVAAAAGLLIAAGVWIGRPGAVPVLSVPASAQIEPLPPDQAQHALEEMDMMQEFSKMLPAESDPRI